MTEVRISNYGLLILFLSRNLTVVYYTFLVFHIILHLNLIMFSVWHSYGTINSEYIL